MSLHKPSLIITLFLTPKKTFYEFTNSFHAKYKPLSSKCWLRLKDVPPLHIVSYFDVTLTQGKAPSIALFTFG